MILSINLVLIALTVLVSISAFQNNALRQKCVLHPYTMKEQREWYRFISSGFIHADWVHLLMNMIVLFYFGTVVESWLVGINQPTGRLLYVAFYIVAIAIANISSYLKHRNNPGYRSLGASGAVSAVVFASIICQPGMVVRFIFLPVNIPGYVFAVLYIIYSIGMARYGKDQINHEAHLYGALFGLAFASVLSPAHLIAFLDYFANLL